jgi:hypothetical protein
MRFSVKRTASPPGKNWGARWLRSPVANAVRDFGVPPATETVDGATVLSRPKTIVSSGAQGAPRVLFTGQSVIAAPPAMGTFLSFPSAAKPIQTPSGDKKGGSAPSVPAMGRGLELLDRANVELLRVAARADENEASTVRGKRDRRRHVHEVEARPGLQRNREARRRPRLRSRGAHEQPGRETCRDQRPRQYNT